MKPGLGRGLDSLLKIYDEEDSEAESKFSEKEPSVSKVEIRNGDVQKIDIHKFFVIFFLLNGIKYRSAGQCRELNQRARGKACGDDG